MLYLISVVAVSALCLFLMVPYVGRLWHFLVIPQAYNFERKIVNILLPISFNICFGYSKEPSQY